MPTAVLRHLDQAARAAGLERLSRELRRGLTRRGRTIVLSGPELSSLLDSPRVTGRASLALLNDMAGQLIVAEAYERDADDRVRAVKRRAAGRSLGGTTA